MRSAAGRSGRPGLFGVLLAAALLAAGGVATAYQELLPFVAGGLTAESRYASLLNGNLLSGQSLLSKHLVLDTCHEALTGVYGRMQPAETRTPVLERCRSGADEIVAGAPSYAFGWYVGARAAAELGDLPGFNRRLLRSQVTGPTEQWVAELRAALVEDNYAGADDAVRVRHDDDLRLLVISARGIDSIARRYVDDPAFRERITAIVETLPEADQARFVARVRLGAEAGAAQ